MGKEISKTFPDRRGSVKWEENVRDKLHKKISKSQVEGKK